MSITINITGQLSNGLVEMYQLVEQQANNLGIEFLIVGAMARDLVLHHGFDAAIERGTRDVDFAIRVESWDVFNQLKTMLLENSFNEDPKKVHRLTFISSEGEPWELDILPFGDISNDQQDIEWPPEGDFIMSMLGFEEALNNAWQVQISDSPESIVPVANPTSMIVLKLVAWTERDQQIRKKDAQDIDYIIKSYAKIPDVGNSLYNDNYMQECDFDEDLATAMKLGDEIREISSDQTIEYLQKHFIEHHNNKRGLAEEMECDEAFIDQLLKD